MDFDLDGAKSAGYSDEEIAAHLSKQEGFDLDGAVNSGYGYGEVVSHLMPTPDAPEPTPDDQSFFREIADIPLGIGRGAVTGVQMISDVFGASNVTSDKLTEIGTYIDSLMSAQSKQDAQESARIQAEAEGKGIWEEVKGGLQAFAVRPLDFMANAAGTIAPIVAGTLMAPEAAAVVVGMTLGAVMGTGVVKNAIHTAVRDEMLKQGVPDAQANEAAEIAQSYTGDNLDQIGLGTVLGVWAAKSGIEPVLTKLITRKAVEKASVDLAKQAAQKGIGRRVIEGGLVEAVPEAFQGGQERLAQNVALQREGVNTPTFKGVAGQATMEGLAGLGLGAGLGSVNRQQALPIPEIDSETGEIMPSTAYHGSPHKFDQFKVSQIGTGEGAQAFGYGLYFAENREVAGGYRTTIFNQHIQEADVLAKKVLNDYDGDVEDAIDNLRQLGRQDAAQVLADDTDLSNVSTSDGAGNLYEVDIPDSTIDRMLDWDKPLSEQPESVRRVLSGESSLIEPDADLDFEGPFDDGGISGGDIYSRLAREIGQEAASAKLNELGIPGIKYLDGASRGKGEGTRNFVVFDENSIKVLKRGDEVLASTAPSDILNSVVSEPESGRNELLDYFGSELAATTTLEIVNAPMLGAIKNDQILRAVVESIPVDVMNVLSDNGISPEEFVRKPNVVGHRLPINVRPTVTGGLLDAFESVRTRLRTALLRVLSSESGRGDEEVLAAVRANDLDLRVVSGLLAPSFVYGIDETGRNEALSGASRASLGAELPVTGLDDAGISGEPSAAELAILLNRHERSIPDSPSDVVTEGLTANALSKAVSKALAPKHASSINVVQTAEEIPNFETMQQIGDHEGFYDPKTKRIYLIADNIASGDRGVWVAWHELLHKGIRIKYGNLLSDALTLADRNGTINSLTNAIMKDRSMSEDQRKLAVEEALAELNAAQRTGDYEGIQTRYSVAIPESLQAGWRNALKRFMQSLRNIMSRVLGKSMKDVPDSEIWALFAGADVAVEGRADVAVEGRAESMFDHDLPMDEASRMARAEAMGFDTGKVWYHGTHSEFESFKTSNTGEFGPGVYLTDSVNEAGGYAPTGRRTGNAGQNIVPVLTKLKNPLKIKSPDEFWDRFKSDSDAESVQKAIAAGYDGIVYRRAVQVWDNKINKAVNTGEMQRHMVVFNPSNIRSIHAAFDPAEIDSPNLLASTAPKYDDPILQSTAERIGRHETLMDNFGKAFSPENKAALKSFWDRHFRAKGNLPDSVFDAKIKRDTGIGAEEMAIGYMVTDFERAVRKIYHKPYTSLPQFEITKINAFLAGEVSDVSPAIKETLKPMRAYLDNLSSLMVSSGVISIPESAKKVLGNRGKYLNRSYQVFDDPKWHKKVSEEIMDGAYNYLAEELSGENTRSRHDKITGIINGILYDKTAADSIGAFISEGKLGAKDLSILIKKKDIVEPIRLLMGEYTDAKVNFTRSATKMQRLIGNHIFQKEVRKDGIGKYLFKERKGEYSVPIASDKSKSLEELAGLYTTPEIRRAFSDALNPQDFGSLYRGIIAANALVKYGKTVIAPTTMSRNIVSALFFSMANGHLLTTTVLKDIKNSGSVLFGEILTRKEQREYALKLKRLGATLDNPYAGEMIGAINDAMVDSPVGGPVKHGVRKTASFFTTLYQYGDDFWKIIGFESEKAALQKAGFSAEEAEIESAKRIRDTYPTYSLVGSAIKRLRRFPLIGTFVSFPAEILRTSVNIARMIHSDMQQPALRPLAIRRMVGVSIAGGWAMALSALSMALMGIGDEEDEAVRKSGAPWSRNSNLLYIGYDKDGLPEYIDISYTDPYNYLKRPINAIMTKGSLDDTLTSMGRDLFDPFLGPDIASSAIGEAVFNRKLEADGSGGPVYNPNADASTQLSEIATHIGSAIAPGVFGNISRIYKAARGDSSRYGKKYNMRDEVMALVGARKTTANPLLGLSFRSSDYKNGLRNAQRILREQVSGLNKVSDKKLKSKFNEMISNRDKVSNELIEFIKLVRTMGKSDREIRAVLRTSKVGGKEISWLMRGRIPPWKFTMGSMADTRHRIIATVPLSRRKETLDQLKHRVKYVAELYRGYRQRLAAERREENSKKSAPDRKAKGANNTAQ